MDPKILQSLVYEHPKRITPLLVMKNKLGPFPPRHSEEMSGNLDFGIAFGNRR